MKNRIKLVLLLVILTSVAYGQDTISYLTSKCLSQELTTLQKIKVQNIDSTIINYEYLGDTLKLSGTIQVNCCGTHMAIVNRMNDSIFIETLDTGNLCWCNCPYLFEIKLPHASNDSILKVIYGYIHKTNNFYIYKLHSPASQVPTIEKVSISFFPNPIENHLRVEFNELSKMNKYQLRLSTISSVVLWTSVINQQSSDIDMSAYPAGVYFIQLFDNENSMVINRKIIKK
jgi:Secretion system C-terminal sorting domain